jgi:tRNA dimethylallyltransferase
VIGHEPIVALVGPTASGKTDASLPVAERLGAEIVCVDSMLVYRGLDVGTAKPTPAQRKRVPHYMLDVVDPAESFSVAGFQGLAREAVADIESRGRRPLLVGSGGLYYRAVVDGLEFPGTMAATRALLEAEAVALGPQALHRRLQAFDPEAAGKIESTNSRRTIRALEVAAITGRPFSSYAGNWNHYPETAVRAAGIGLSRTSLHRRIERRVLAMMPGLLDETSRLLERGFGSFLTSSQAIGYAEAVACLEGSVGPDEAAAITVKRTKALARRQMAWLRRDPRIRWFAAGEEGAVGLVEEMVAYLRGDHAETKPKAIATVEARGSRGVQDR